MRPFMSLGFILTGDSLEKSFMVLSLSIAPTVHGWGD
jgi:hypothetical protein